jgi:colanic acid/amylovoran biosynthesis glycosyltransferase
LAANRASSSISDIMRIAYLINQYPKVSHTFIRREILALERQGVQILRISLRDCEGELIDEADLAERALTRYVLRRGALALLFAVLRTLATKPRRLRAALAIAWRMSRSSDRPLLVHLAYLAEACLIGPWLREGGVQHLHVHFGTNPATVAMLINALGGPQWSFTVHGPEEFHRREPIRLADKVRDCHFVIAISSYGRSQLYSCVERQHWPKIHVLYCGLEPAFFAAPVSPANPVRRLICVGRLSPEKGQLLLIEAARRIAADASDFELVLAGDGNMRPEIEVLIARYKLTPHVRITGWISSEEIRREILSARALVLPSFAEGLPVVLMEAMALKRPVISTFVAGIPELVQPGEHGWLVPAGDLEALISAMQECLDAPLDMLARLGRAAHTRVVARHNVDIEAAKLASLFKGAAQQASTSPSSYRGWASKTLR